MFLRSLLAVGLPFAAVALHAAVIEVNPGGPVPSLAAARDAVRQARASGEKGAFTVRIAAGEYPLEEAVIFEPQDSGVTYEAAPGAKPVFVGSRQITGWEAGADGVWTAQLEPGVTFEALWMNGQRATRARSPNNGYLYPLGLPPAPLPDVPLAGERAKTMLQVKPEDAALLRGFGPADLRDVNVVVYHSWNETRHRVAGVRVEDGTLQFTGGSRAFFSLEPFHRLHLENFRGALDAPGEWFLERDGTLFYQPRAGEKPETAFAEFPLARQWLVFKGEPAKDESLVRDLQFRGLSFRGQRYTLPPEGVGYSQAEVGLDAAIEADGVRGLTFERCNFEQTMTNAVWLRRGCREVILRDCLMRDLGAGGVKIGEPAIGDGKSHTSHVTIDNCIIHTGGRYFTSAIGVLIFHASDCTVRHCDIADFFYSAISIGWTWGYKATPCARNLIENCRLHHLGWGVLSDMGGVYTLGPQPGTVIRGCHIHDIGCASYGGWGMYNDEGSVGIVWENNLVHHTQSAGYHQHYGRGNIVRNNIIAFGAEEHVRWSRPEEFLAFAFEKNIVLLGEGRLFMHVDKNWDTGRVFLSDNVYWRPAGSIPEFAGKSWQDWQFLGRDNTSVVADPLFVAPEKGDWTLRPESPALKLGFVPFDWKKAGVTGEDAWRKMAATEFPPMIYGLKPKTPPLKLRDDFESTPLGAPPSVAKHGKQPIGMKVAATQPSHGSRCLELTDGPDALPAFEPHFYYKTNVERGTARVAFDVRAEPAYHLVHEWRDESARYNTGPKLELTKGVLTASGRKLAELPADGWTRVEVSARIDGDATWSCTITLPGGAPQRFDGLKFATPGMKALKWIGFASNGKTAARCWIDDVEIDAAE